MGTVLCVKKANSTWVLAKSCYVLGTVIDTEIYL